jgi:hypothetical protein
MVTELAELSNFDDARIEASGNLSVALEIMFKGGLLVWAVDELFRGVNPWRRCLGAAVLGYELSFYDRLSGLITFPLLSASKA